MLVCGAAMLNYQNVILPRNLLFLIVCNVLSLLIPGAQYAWLKDDLHQLDRTVTPWLVAAWHPPWYNSYSSHYQEFECMRQEMEALLYQYGVDIVFSGHVSLSGFYL